MATRPARPFLGSAVPGKEGHIGEGTVFVVDDEEPMRNALRRLLSSSGFSVHTFSNADSFLESHHRDGPSCVLLDLHMPGMNGLQLQEELQVRGISIPIIFLTGAGSVAQAVSAMHAGAVDFLEKPFSNDALVERVRKALQADREALERDFRHRLVKEKVATLTPREKEVLVLLSKGQSNKVIARALDISPRTVEGYRARLMEKLEAKSVAELVRIVEQAQ